MLGSFDWIRRSRTGAELLATLRCFAAKSPQSPFNKEELGGFSHEEEIGPPPSALNSPCQRCWIYPRMVSSDQEDYLYCKFCKAILDGTRGLGPISRKSVVVWGFVNRLPEQFLMLDTRYSILDNPASSIQNPVSSIQIDRRQEILKSEVSSLKSQVLSPKSFKRFLGAYVHDENRFLLVMLRRELRTWLQELILYNGAVLKGLIQIFPTTGPGRELSMGDILCRAIHHEANHPMDQLRIRFYSHPYQILRPHVREQKGLLTFEASEFLNLLEIVKVFRVLLRPEEQKMLHEILTIDKAVEEQFYWGRFLGSLSQEAKDMLDSWKIRRWPKDQIRLLYELLDYVPLPQLH